MKKYLFNLLLIAISSFTFINTYSAQCNYNVDMQDSFGDGWNGASIDVSVNGAFVTNFTIATGSSGSGSFSTYTNDIVEFTFNSGTWDSEITWDLTGSDTSEFAPGGNGTKTCSGSS